MTNSIVPLSHAAQQFQPGTYRHFKGGIYEALFVARNSENRDEECVVYRSLDTGDIWFRPLAMFLENVERDGYKGPRFTKIDIV